MTADGTPQLRHVIALWGALRVGLGAVALVAPRAASAVWVGSAVPEPTRAVLGRALGGRDLALGAGTTVSAMTGGAMTSWIVASSVADAVDAAATVAMWSQLPRGRRALVVMASTGSTLTAAVLASLSRRARQAP